MKANNCIKLFNLLVIFLGVSSALSSQVFFYFEKQDVLAQANLNYLQARANDNAIFLSWQESTANGLFISVMVSRNGKDWDKKELALGPIFQQDESVLYYYSAIDNNNNYYICYKSAETALTIARSNDFAGRFQIIKVIERPAPVFLPRIYIDNENELDILFSQDITDELVDIYYAKFSANSMELLDPQRLVNGLRGSFLPDMAHDNNNSVVVWQSWGRGDDFNFKIFSKTSSDNGKTWSEEKELIPARETNNQRPYIEIFNNTMHIAWEKEDKNYISKANYQTFDLNGNQLSNELQVSDTTREAFSPRIIKHWENIYLFWFDNRNGSFQNYYSRIDGSFFTDNIRLNANTGKSWQNEPVIFRNEVYLYWVQTIKNKNAIIGIRPDKTVKTPEIFSNSFTPGVPSKKKAIRFKWKRMSDISGMLGYAYAWNKDPNYTPTEMNIYEGIYSKDVVSSKDGKWFFHLRALDNAGNFSATARLLYTFDTTPPEPPVFSEILLDEKGFLQTNSPEVSWDSSNEPLTNFAFTYRLVVMEDISETYQDLNIQAELDKLKTPVKPEATRNTINFTNLDNGILLFKVVGRDQAGNISKPGEIFFLLNKYEPVTYISNIKVSTNNLDHHRLTLIGRGFNIGGDLELIHIDRDTKEPYDYTLTNDKFHVTNDRLVRMNRSMELDDGVYYVGADHPERGLYFTQKPILRIEGRWIFTYTPAEKWQVASTSFIGSFLSQTTIVISLILIFIVVVSLILLFHIFKIIREELWIKKQVKLILHEEISMPDEKAKTEEIKKLEKRGLGLTFKFAFLIVMLIIFIITGTVFSLSLIVLNSERENLAQEMKKRVEVAMKNYNGVVSTQIITGLQFDVSDTTFDISRITEDLIFISVFPEKSTGKTPEIRFGQQVRSDLIIPSDLLQTIPRENQQKYVEDEYLNIFNEKYNTDEINSVLAAMKEKKDMAIKIIPAFDPKKLQDKYLFLSSLARTVRTQEDGKIVEKVTDIIGNVRIVFSFENILKTIEAETWKVIRITLIVIVIAISVGLIGAVLMAAITVGPIKRITKYVRIVSETEDLETLSGTENETVEVKSKDEIGALATDINEMTHKLIEKAKSDKQLMLGKEIQKKFIPLEPHETDYIDIFGFYEGAKGVSGDYFDFRKLNDSHYAFIVCDVAGKAVPAALIMVQISTIFSSYFATWKQSVNGYKTVPVVDLINDQVADRGFPGRFAAILVGIINVKTGKIYMTNAGYTQLVYYDTAKGKAVIKKLNPDAGAAGVMPTMFLPNPYMQEAMVLKKGDTLLLFSDGIEESRSGKTIIGEDGDEIPEEFGLDRILEVMNNVKGGKTPKDLIESIIKTENVFRGKEEQYDDLTLLAIKKK